MTFPAPSSLTSRRSPGRDGMRLRRPFLSHRTEWRGTEGKKRSRSRSPCNRKIPKNSKKAGSPPSLVDLLLRCVVVTAFWPVVKPSLWKTQRPPRRDRDRDTRRPGGKGRGLAATALRGGSVDSAPTASLARKLVFATSSATLSNDLRRTTPRPLRCPHPGSLAPSAGPPARDQGPLGQVRPWGG